MRILSPVQCFFGLERGMVLCTRQNKIRRSGHEGMDIMPQRRNNDRNRMQSHTCRSFMRQIRVQDATNRFIRQRLAISLRQEVPFGQRCQSYICRRTRTPDSVGCIHFGNPTPMRLCLRKELLASSPIFVSTVTRFFTTPYPINSTTPSA